MIVKYGKPIQPAKFQADVLKNIKAYAANMKARALKYRRLATVPVRSCYVCNSKKSTPLLTVYGFSYVQCSACSHVYLTKRLPQAALNNFYAESADYAKTYTSKAQIDYRIKHIAGPKVAFAMKFAPKVKNGLWLDVGSAIGDIPKCIEGYKGWKAIGTEISRDSVAVGKKFLGVDLRRILFQDFLKQNKKLMFDAISFFGYVELVTEPMKELKLARQHLKKGGLMVIGEANPNSFSTILQKSFPEYSTRHIIPPPIIQQFTRKSMTVALEKAGFEPVAYWNFGLDFYEFLKYMALLVPGAEQSPAYEFLMAHLNEFQAVIDRKEMGDCFMMVAKAV